MRTPPTARCCAASSASSSAADELQVKFKLNQNHPPQSVEGAIRGLRASDSQDAQATAALMEHAAAGAAAVKTDATR